MVFFAPLRLCAFAGENSFERQLLQGLEDYEEYVYARNYSRKDAKKAFEAPQRFAPLRLCASNFSHTRPFRSYLKT